MACISGSIEVVQRLLQGGADASAHDTAGETPFDEAFRYQRETIVIRMLVTLSILWYNIPLFSIKIIFFVFPYSQQ